MPPKVIISSMRAINLLSLLFFISCSLEYFNDGEIVRDGHFQLYSNPHWEDELFDFERYKRVVVVATNDSFGHVMAHEERTAHTKTGKGLVYQVGGPATLARYFEILRYKFPQQTLFLDAGNIYKGSLIASFDQGESISLLYNKLGYDAITIGNHDFEFGPLDLKKNIAHLYEDPQGQLKKNISLHKAPYVVSNIVDLKTARLIKWKNTYPYIIKEVNGLKVAVIGGVSSFSWKSIRKENLRGIYVGGLSKSLVKYASIARKKGAQVVVALVHAAAHCGQGLMKKYNLNQYQVNFNPKGKNFCNSDHEIFKVIDSMPKGTVDVVVSGHSRSKVANFYRDIPIIQSFSNGRFLGRIEIFYDLVKKKVDQEKTRIYQPTKVCHHFFKVSKDCYSGDPTMRFRALEPATFLGELVYPLAHIKRIVQQYKSRVWAKSQKKIVQLDSALNQELLKASSLGSVISYSIRKATNAQIGFTTHTRAIQKGRKKGVITYKDIYEALPREGHLSKVSLSGKELKGLVEIATSGDGLQLGQFSGLKVVLYHGILEKRDLNGDGKKENWENNRLKSIKLDDGSKIVDDKIYTLGIQTFFSENSVGGYDFIFSNVGEERKTIFYDKTNRQALFDLFESFSGDQKVLKKILDDEKNWLIII